jgi:hypothetical protein
MNDALEAIAQLHKEWDERFSFAFPDLLECYLDGRIVFHLEFRIRGPAKGHPMDLYAVLNSPRIGTGGWWEFNSEIGSWIVVSRDGDHVTHRHDVANDDQKPVLICNIEVVNDSQESLSGMAATLLCLRRRFDMSAIARKNIINRQQNKAPKRRDEGHHRANAEQKNGVFTPFLIATHARQAFSAKARVRFVAYGCVMGRRRPSAHHTWRTEPDATQ